MRCCESRFGVALVAVVLIGLAKAGHADVKAARAGQEGWVYIDEGISKAFIDEPAHHFQLARDDFLKKDWKAAAAEIRKGSTYLKIETSRAVDEAKPSLLTAVAELETLADQVERGEIASVRRLDALFARAHQALARHHYLKASQFRARGESERIWQDLQAATVHLEHGLAWAGKEVTAGALKAAETARKLGEKVKAGATTWTADQVGRVIEFLGLEIDKLGKHLAPPTK